MPGDWTLGLEERTCGIDKKPCPSRFSRCDMCERNGTARKNKKVKMLQDVNARLLESTRYEMRYAKESIFDCIQLINTVIKEMNENSTDTV